MGLKTVSIRAIGSKYIVALQFIGGIDETETIKCRRYETFIYVIYVVPTALNCWRLIFHRLKSVATKCFKPTAFDGFDFLFNVVVTTADTLTD